MPSTLRSQLALAFGLLVLVLSAAISFSLADRHTKHALADQGDTLHLLAQGTATVLSEGLFERMREVELLAAAPPYKANGQLDLEAWKPVIARMQATRPQFSWIGVTDAPGKVLFATGGLLVGNDVSERPWFRSAQRTAELAAAQDELLRANEALTALAQRDGLTGLFNRRTADDRLRMEMVRHRRTGGSMSVLLLDVDHFKSVNDTLGHAAGDEVLKLVAAQLAACGRACDFVARFGGEEFLMILPETSPQGAEVFAEKIRAAIEANREGSKRVTVSIGIAKHAELFDDPSAVLRTADEALYAAKHGGRNRVVSRSHESGIPQRRAG